MTRFDYKNTVRELESRGIMPDGPPSLDKTHEGLRRILPENKINPESVIVVAGTNGKGSVCASLEALLLSTGKRIGLYTSPHLVETTERIRVNGIDVSQNLFCEAYAEIKSKTCDLKLTHFEVLTLMAAWIFFSGVKANPVDYAIFEVGLGGTWDATNAIPHQHCIITSLGYDHQNLLGKTIQEIAQNKFGIVHNGAIVTHATLPQEVIHLAQQVRSATHSYWKESISYDFEVIPSRAEPQFLLHCAWGSTSLNLPGARGAQNSALALTAFERLGFSPREHLGALSQVRWPGRMEKITLHGARCPVFISGDHNPQGVQSLLQILPHYSRKHLHVLVGIAKDKDFHEILSILSSIPDSSLYLTETPFKGLPLANYGSWLTKAKAASQNPEEAFKRILEFASPDDMILVTGSLYLVGLFKEKASNFVSASDAS